MTLTIAQDTDSSYDPPRCAEHSRIITRLEQILDKWADGCQFCRASGRDGADHSLEDCQRPGIDDVREGLTMFASGRGIRMKMSKTHRGILCPSCYLPSLYCYAIESKADGKSYFYPHVPCRYSGIAEATLFSVYTCFPLQCNLLFDREIELSLQAPISVATGPGWEIFYAWLDGIVESQGHVITRASLMGLVVAECVDRGIFRHRPATNEG